MTTLKFTDGAIQFRQRLVCSLLCHRPLLLRNIRSESLTYPGLRPYEVSFLRLLDSLTNGSVIEINSTGTQVRFKPGILLGGEIVHDCPVGEALTDEPESNDEPRLTTRSIGWYIEGILPLAPFGKTSLDITFTGITDGMNIDPSPDYIAASLLPLMTRFHIGATHEDFSRIAGDDAPARLHIHTRAAAPSGGGKLRLTCPSIRQLQPIDLIDPGLIKRTRGTINSYKLPASSTARAAHAAKGLILRLIPDVWVHTNVCSSRTSGYQGVHGSKECGTSPGMSGTMVTLSTTGCVYCAETCMDASRTREENLPETIGVRCAAWLLEEVRKGGCIDTGAQSLAFLLMCLTPEDKSRIRVGTLSQYSIVSLRLFKMAFLVEFEVKADQESRTVLLSCLGSGYRNMARSAT